jgi:hypothetical protein
MSQFQGLWNVMAISMPEAQIAMSPTQAVFSL